ncbi:MAG: hypothetical protein IJ489_07445 [Clostridia bacterium]|nr:hypothetical protein [Clostridia bacterium]
MKKFLSLILSAALLLGTCSFVGCGKKEKTLKLGLGLYTSVKTTDATEDKNGQGQAIVTGASVLIDDEGKIVKCFIDCADHKVDYTADGQAITNDSFATKYEQGDSYGMKAYGGAAKEWYEQADAFCALAMGKTLSEIKALVASDNKGTDAVINAGCTIDVSEFVLAIEKAIANAAPSDATAKDNLKLGVSTAQSARDATEDKNGQNQLETTFFAAALNAENQITAAKTDCVQIQFTFDMNGASTFDTTKAVVSKGEQGDAYGMKTYGGAAKEWYEQADVFCASAIGKTIGEVGALLGENGYGSADLQSAGCTVNVEGFVKAASKID